MRHILVPVLPKRPANMRRTLTIGLLSLPGWLQGCAQPFRHISVDLPPGTRIEALTVFYDVEYSNRFLDGVPGFGPFQSAVFRELFETTTTELLSHNGASAYGTTRPPTGGAAYLLRIRPVDAMSLQRGVPMKLVLSAELFSPGGPRVGEWLLDMNARVPAVPEATMQHELEKAIAQYILLTLRVLQAKSLVSLRFDPPQTMAGSTNAFFGKVR